MRLAVVIMLLCCTAQAESSWVPGWITNRVDGMIAPLKMAQAFDVQCCRSNAVVQMDALNPGDTVDVGLSWELEHPTAAFVKLTIPDGKPKEPTELKILK